MFVCIHAPGFEPGPNDDRLLELAGSFSPRVEQTTSRTVIFAADGLERLIGGPQQVMEAVAARAAAAGLCIQAAHASNPDVAFQAACHWPGLTLVPPGQEGRVLAPLPIETLPLDPEMAETLCRWGVRTLGDLAALPETGLVARFGPAVRDLQAMARGEAVRLLHRFEPPVPCAQRLDLDDPVDSLESLMFLLARLLNELCGKLSERWLAMDHLCLTVELETGARHIRSLRLPMATTDSVSLLKLVRLDLEAHPPPAPVTAVVVEGHPARRRSVQTGLFAPQAPEPERLELTLMRLRGVVGDENAGSPQPQDTHRPDAFHIARFQGEPAAPRDLPRQLHLALRLFRPPLAARVDTNSGHPHRIAASGICGLVEHCAGPWRTSGDWWSGAPWARDEWDVALSDGALYRVVLERPYCPELGGGSLGAGQWFVDGRYD